MKLESIAISEFRQFSGRLVIGDLQPGLNLFTGPNEAGKSTIAEAVRTVFLERYKASHLKDLLPWGKASGQPAVEVSFNLDGVACTLAKQFVTRQRCDLRIGQQVFGEDEAEDRLAALLGFSRATRGAMKADQAGVPGLLWVQQGETHDVRDASGHAALYLRDALTQLSGGNSSAGEDVLIGAVQGELRQLLTARTQRATGPLAEAEQALAALAAERDTLDAQRRQFDENLTRLATQQEAFEDALRKRPWEAHEQKAVEAQARAAALAELERSVEGLAQTLHVSEVELAMSLQQEKNAAELEATLANDRQKLEQAKAAVLAAEAEHAQASAALTRCQQVNDAANRALELANAAVMAQELNNQIALYRAEIVRLETSIAAAEAAQAAVLDATRSAASLEIDVAQLQKLQALESRVSVLRARKEAAMTRIDYRLSGGVIVVDGATLTGEGVLRLDDAQTIELPGVGELRIVPGVSDLAALRAELSGAEVQQAELLRSLGVASLGDAQARHEQWKAQVAHLRSQQEILAVHAPEGIEPLRAALASALARRQTADERLAALPDVARAPAVDEARRAADNARQALESATRALTQTGEQRSNAVAASGSLAEQVQRKDAQLQDETFRARRAQWQAKIVEQRAHVAALTRQRDERNQALSAARTDDPAAEAKRYRVSADLARNEQQERQVRIAELRSQLETMGASGLGERLAAVRASLEQMERRRAELSLRAGALSLLDKVLVEERDSAVAQLRAPLTERLGHYLKRLFPQSALELGDDLSPIALQRDGRIDTLDALSFGTREQMGILARLAYADLLKASGRPTLLMLDDAAVHTDGMRRDALKRALLDAATRHQILLFTCHPELWDDLGVKQRSIDDLRAAA
ncbi:AAA family ATPase [Paraburkholderia phenazinium]|uniref:DNA repair exonuclease SbcCD ATPase subunit n=1 Tax=Paraburkholderia phenazinium TaxID=60549 RepID=A0A1G8MS72_9BURK|nr:AAA family ATPase [Paraburkholderia phenazinium]SDI70821.1 DNA repair exonuclease SbcCD ATPase subunit [Paraburkholderia phenazinium]